MLFVNVLQTVLGVDLGEVFTVEGNGEKYVCMLVENGLNIRYEHAFISERGSSISDQILSGKLKKKEE